MADTGASAEEAMQVSAALSSRPKPSRVYRLNEFPGDDQQDDEESEESSEEEEDDEDDDSEDSSSDDSDEDESSLGSLDVSNIFAMPPPAKKTELPPVEESSSEEGDPLDDSNYWPYETSSEEEEELPLPPGWEEQLCPRTKMPFYINKAENKASWMRPKPEPVAQPEATTAAESKSNQNREESSAAGNPDGRDLGDESSGRLSLAASSNPRSENGKNSPQGSAAFNATSLTEFKLNREIAAASEAAHKGILKDYQRRPEELDISWLEDPESSSDELYHNHKAKYGVEEGLDSDKTKETQAMFDASTNSLGARKKLFRRRKNRLTASDRTNNEDMDSSKRLLEVETVDPIQNNSQPETKKEYAFALALGTTLTFNMGFVNGACFSGFLVEGVKEPVAGYTTPYTDFAIKLAEGDYDRVLFQTLMVCCFVGGSFVSGAVTPNAVPYRIEPTYGPSFLLAGICLVFSSFFAAIEKYNNVVFYLAAAAGGVQNGISSAYTAKLIRSTGLTGSSTDIGLYFGQYVRGNKENTSKLVVLCMLTIAFTTGGFVAFYVVQVFTSLTLLVSAVLFILIGMSMTIFLTQKLNISFKSAILGTWKWQAAADGIKSVFAQALNMDGSALHLMSVREIDDMFDRIDADGNGTIDGEELFILLRSTGAKVSRNESDMMLQYADKDGDGCLDREEWRTIVQAAVSQRISVAQRTKKLVGSTVNMTSSVVGSTVGMAGNMAASTRDLMGSSARHLLVSTTTGARSLRPKRGKRASVLRSLSESDLDTSNQDSSRELKEGLPRIRPSEDWQEPKQEGKPSSSPCEDGQQPKNQD